MTPLPALFLPWGAGGRSGVGTRFQGLASKPWTLGAVDQMQGRGEVSEVFASSAKFKGT